MSEKELIKICLNEICRKMGYADPVTLRQRDFEHLSDEIENTTGTLISISTIKRLLNGQFNHLPQAATLNAIATYLGYKSWHELRRTKQLEHEVRPPHSERSQKKRRLRVSYSISVLIIVMILFLMIVSLTYFSKHPSIKEKDVSFSVKKTTSNDVPNTVVFTYDIDKVPGDSFFIQQSWDRDRRVKIEKNKHTLTDIYYEPGYHNAKLIINNQVVKTIDVSIPTNGWFFFSKPGFFKGLPTYIQPAMPVKNGVLSLTREDIIHSKIDAERENFYYYARFPQKCDVGADNFRLKARIRFKTINNVICPMILHEVYGQSNSLYFITTLPGCTGNVDVNVGEHFLSGKTTDLSGFGGDICQWQDIEVVVKNKEAHFYIDQREIFTRSYIKSPGLITGLSFMSNGLCEIDYISLKGLDGKVVYEDNF